MEKTTGTRFPNKRSFILYILKGNLIFFIASMVLSAAIAVLDLINPRIVSCVVDHVFGTVPVIQGSVNEIMLTLAGGAENVRAHLYIPAFAVAAVALTTALVRYGQGITNTLGAEKLVCRIRNVLFSHTDRLPMSWYGRNQTGDILQRCTSDV
ncbi:MAG: ABC transporter ATP-binding protein, partial [Oscillospiraceae bacterium]|nr:ABC transporter ATP-binding protein [Oscillospiraceae bacterium]